MDRTRLSYVSAMVIGAGSAIVFAWWWWLKGRKLQTPIKWRKIGELSDIFIFPVKSLGYIRECAIECTKLGCKSGWLRDRTLMLVNLDGKFVTARQIPRMVLIKPSIAGSVLTLHAPGMMTISIDLANLGKTTVKTVIWGQSVLACDCGEDVARWLSRFLVQEDTGLRMVYYPLEKSCRDVRSPNKGFPLMENVDAGAYSDATSYTLMNEASIVDLNSRLDDPITPLQFRPNFVVKGAEPLEEDTWDWIKIGSVIFRNVKPCTRCVLTTVDPEAGVKNTANEPLETLKKYRQIEDPKFRQYVGESPVMGIHMGLKGETGLVKLGDPVYVGVPENEENNPLNSPL